MGGILFLIGCTGFYFLFLYQGMRVAKITLSNMELYTQDVIESMPAGLITLDGDGRIVSCNTKAEELVGNSASLQNKRLSEIFPDWPVEISNDGKAIIERSLDCQQEAGEQIPVKVSGSRLLDQDGKE